MREEDGAPGCNAELWGCNRRTGMAVHLTRALLADPDILILSDPVVHHTPDEVRSGSSLPRPPSAGLPRTAPSAGPRPPSASLTRASACVCKHPSSYHGEVGPERP